MPFEVHARSAIGSPAGVSWRAAAPAGISWRAAAPVAVPGALAWILAWAAAPGALPAPQAPAGASSSAPASPVALTDITILSGVDFLHRNGASGAKYACELIGPGGALLDFDGDGDLDLYLVNGAALPGVDYRVPPENALFENVGFPAPGAAGGPPRDPPAPTTGAPAPAVSPPSPPAFRPPFFRVPGAAGAADTGYGMGAACGDYDNDGDPDLYVTNFGRNTLYRNDGGRFTDVTDLAGVGDPRWGTSAAFVDIDHDGFLDLYVCNYFRYRIEDHEWYGLRKPGYRTHGGPASFHPDFDILYRNRGDGTFKDVSESSGILLDEPNFALGVVAGDFDDDGDTDLYVTNDTQPNRLFLNDGAGRFVEDGTIAGCAYEQGGKPQAGMGVDAQDYDGDGLVDIFCTNFSLETNTLYRAEAPGFFVDVSYETGLGEAALPYLGFGTGFLDLENDRDLDLFVVNGHIMDNVRLYFDNLSFKQSNQLFLNEGGRFRKAGDSWGRAVTLEEASRGALFGDLDNDGDTDIVVLDVATSPQILRNDGGNRNGWVRVQLRGTRSNHDGYGADVRVTAAGTTRRYQVRAAYGYLSSNDPRLLAGLGAAPAADRIEVRWPSGAIDRIADVPARRAVLFTEGEGGKVLPEKLPSLGWAMEEGS